MIVYSIAIFLSSALLFLIEPIMAKILLPLFGGSPSVWNTCVVFYQSILLLGYTYAHFIASRLKKRFYIILHLALIVITLIYFPINVSGMKTIWANSYPPLAVIFLLFKYIGLPFFALSVTSPLLQKWYEKCKFRNYENPYFLYRSSNLGSLIGLLAYPLLWERYFEIGRQTDYWGIMYVVFAILLVSAGILVLRRGYKSEPFAAEVVDSATEDNTVALDNAVVPDNTMAPDNAVVPNTILKLKWIILAFIPSSLMLSVTTYLTENLFISQNPLFWIIPLGLYLLTFVITFSRKQIVTPNQTIKLFLFALACLLISMFMDTTSYIRVMLTITLGSYFIIALTCHTFLSSIKPHVRYLTNFYFYMSLGGALGGIFNSIIAPLVFKTSVEFIIVLAITPYVLLLIYMKRKLSKLINITMLLLLVAATALYAYVPYTKSLLLSRDYYGIYKVTFEPDVNAFALSHGKIIHGEQYLSPDKKLLPTSYYHPDGPAGNFFKTVKPLSINWNIGSIGLGIGSLLYYKQDTLQKWTIYEISPQVVKIASDNRYFSYVSTFKPEIVLGDARISLTKEPDKKFDLLILDAYSSDSPPIHLLTLESFELYLKKCTTDGILLIHCSNNVLNLEPLLASIFKTLNVNAAIKVDFNLNKNSDNPASKPSIWAVAGNSTIINELTAKENWRPLAEKADFRVWTDSYSSILSVLK